MINLDYFVPIAEAREKVGPDQVLLGNIDPVRVLCEGSPESASAVRLPSVTAKLALVTLRVLGARCLEIRPLENLRALTRYAQEH